MFDQLMYLFNPWKTTGDYMMTKKKFLFRLLTYIPEQTDEKKKK